MFRSQDTAQFPTHSASARPIDPPRVSASDDVGLVDKIRNFSSRAEDMIDDLSDPIKPYLPVCGRFLIVVTFLEDALRIITQWSDQEYFLCKHMGYPYLLALLFLALNVIVMLACSSLVIVQRHTEYAVAGLVGVVVAQAIGYGLWMEMSFLFRNLSIVGGLLMVLSDSLLRSSKLKARELFANLPTSQLSPKDRHKYLIAAGRVLLVCLFLGFVLHGEWTLWRVLISILGLITCVMVAVGFKAKWSAMFLVLALSVFNFFINNFWSVHSTVPARDFLKYDFFQTLSIIGGLLLLVNIGPGNLSMDEKKKIY